jgi:CubicO group peptidase (beta-lactamase class C family)
MKACIVVFVASLALTAFSPAQSQSLQKQSPQGQSQGKSSPEQSFRDSFDQMVHEEAVVGAAYVVLVKGRIVETHDVGMADQEAHQPVDPNTLFHWASISKTFTAVSIMQLRDRGKLSLDDPIIKYVPELTRVHSEDNDIAKVTIRHLLSHSAGFQDRTWPYTDGKPWQPFEPTEWSQLVAMMPYQELAFAPGTKFQYSNPGFIYLARVIEALTGDPFETYVQKNIFSPLGMTHTYFNVTPYYLAKDRARSYTLHLDASGRVSTEAHPREFDTGITTGNGGINAPLSDMAKWIAFLSGAASTEVSDIVLSRKSLDEMWRPVVTVKDSGPGPVSMGLSFFLSTRGSGSDAVTFVGHTGEQAGFTSFFFLNPHNGHAVIANFNTNRDSGSTASEEKFANEYYERFRQLMEQAMTILH